MIVEIFCFESDSYGQYTVNRRINDYIKSNESKGFSVVDKTVTVAETGSNSLIKPQVTITVWMDKND